MLHNSRWRNANTPPLVSHVACGLIHLNLLAKIATKLFLVGITFLLLLYNFAFALSLLYFLRKVFDIMYEYLLNGYYSLPFQFSRKILPVTLTLPFFSFMLYIPIRFFWAAQTKNQLNVRSPQGGNAVIWKRLKYFWWFYCDTNNRQNNW